VLQWNPDGQLSAWQNAPQTPSATESNLYDGSGSLVEQQTTSNGTTTTSVFVGDLEEVVTTGGTTTTTTYYYADGKRIALAVNGVFSYLANDELGSSEVGMDGSGNALASRLYTPYGTARYSQGTMPTDYGFTGQRNDVTTGLQYYGSRFYDPQAAQFVSADTVLPGSGDDPLGLSRYAYVEGNPVIRTDPSGHAWWSGAWNAVQHFVSHVGSVVHSVVSGGVSWVSGVVASFHPAVAAVITHYRTIVRWTTAWWPVRRSTRMTAHPQRRQINKMAVVPGPSGKIKDPLHRRPNPPQTTPLPDRKPRPNIMAIVGLGPLIQITIPGDFPGLSNIMFNSDKGKSGNEGESPPQLKGDGKVHGEIPPYLPPGWTRADLKDLKSDLETSIATRKAQQNQLGEDPAHRARIADEERLLRQVDKKLSGS
jgi:RHS repeat-associated protein